MLARCALPSRSARSALSAFRSSGSVTSASASSARQLPRALHTSAPRAMLTAHHTPHAPAALGPYSQVLVHHATKTAYLSGCVPLDPATGKIVAGGEGDASAPGVIEKQTEQVLKNLFAVLKAAGADKSSVLKTTVFIKNMEHFKRINAVYEQVRTPNPDSNPPPPSLTLTLTLPPPWPLGSLFSRWFLF